LGKYLTILTNQTIAYNILIILSFTLAGFFAYLLGRQLFKSKLVAIFLGVAYAFCPYLQAHSLQHLTLITAAALIPLFFIFLLKFIENDNIKNLALTALFFVLVLTENFYYGYFLFFALIIFFLVKVIVQLRTKNIDAVKKTLRSFFYLFIIVFCLVLIFNFQLVKPFFNKQTSNVTQSSKRQVAELSVYQASTINYILPSIDHPLFGNLLYKTIKNHLHQSNVFEQTLYVGLALFVLAIMSLFISRNYTVWLFFVLACFAFLFSISPFIQNASYKILPYFRVYARWGLIVFLSTAVLAGFALEKIAKNKFTFLAIIIIIFEFLSFPAQRLTQLNNFPEAYTFLKQQPDEIVVFYPFVSTEELRYNQYLYFQTIHQKRMVNGAIPKTKDDEERLNMLNIENVNTVSKLKNKQVKYIVINKEFYKEGRLPADLWRYYDLSYEKYPIEYLDGRVPNLDKIPDLKMVFTSEQIDIFEINP
jgi:hypothetical protein